MTFDQILNAFVTLIVIIDPVGVAAIFIALTAGLTAAKRKEVALRATVIAFGILLLFGLAGSVILSTMGITLPAFRVAGGFLLFYTAFEMIFEKRRERKEKTVETAVNDTEHDSLAVFPLAIPLIAGPGAISASILLSGEFNGFSERATLFAIISSVLLINYLALLVADKMQKFVGETGRAILTRLLGVLLAALSVQFIADGAKMLFADSV